MQAAKTAEKRFLGHVVSGLGSAEFGMAKRGDPPSPPANEFFVRLRLPSQRLADQVPIRHGLSPDRTNFPGDLPF
jgi:hypothetical protein